MKVPGHDGTGRAALWQSAAIFLLSAALALLINQVRPDGLSLLDGGFSESRVVRGDERERVVSLDEASHLFTSGSAFFLDARSPELFLQGHIPGARNLPWESLDQYLFQVTADIPQDGLILTYCDGKNCPFSGKLAAALLDMGFQNVRTFAGGWSRWLDEGLPSETGPGPGAS